VREPQPLAHAQRVLAHALARGGAVEPDELEQVVDAAFGHADDLGRHGEHLAPAAPGVLRGGVEQHAHALRRVGQVAIGAAEHGRLARVGRREAAQHAQRRGLAGAVGTEEPGHRARLAAERDVLKDAAPAVALGQPV
jgi:hypothetical protein